MSRSTIATELQVPESWLRLAEQRGLLPEFGSCSEEIYRARAAVVRGARSAGVSVARIRTAMMPEEARA